MTLYLAIDKDFCFLFTHREQYGFEPGKELYTYYNYLNVNKENVINNIEAIKQSYESFKLNKMCGGNYTITEL